MPETSQYSIREASSMTCLLAARATVSFASRQIFPALPESSRPSMAKVKTPSRVPRLRNATVEEAGWFMDSALSMPEMGESPNGGRRLDG